MVVHPARLISSSASSRAWPSCPSSFSGQIRCQVGWAQDDWAPGMVDGVVHAALAIGAVMPTANPVNITMDSSTVRMRVFQDTIVLLGSRTRMIMRSIQVVARDRVVSRGRRAGRAASYSA